MRNENIIKGIRYKVMKQSGAPQYLKMGWGERRRTIIVRFRLGNKVREKMYLKK